MRHLSRDLLAALWSALDCTVPVQRVWLYPATDWSTRSAAARIPNFFGARCPTAARCQLSWHIRSVDSEEMGHESQLCSLFI